MWGEKKILTRQRLSCKPRKKKCIVCSQTRPYIRILFFVFKGIKDTCFSLVRPLGLTSRNESQSITPSKVAFLDLKVQSIPTCSRYFFIIVLLLE